MLNTENLKIFDFQEKDVLSWLAELMKHRDAADSQRYGMPTGVYISEVSRGGGAADAGITKGSIIVGFNGITIDSMESLQEQLQYYKKGEKVTLTLQVPGDGGEYQEQTVDVTLGSKAQ